MKLHFDIYLSGRVQKMHKLKPENLQKEADVTLRSEWWSVWRCEHFTSETNGLHLFIFTNATCFHSIIVVRKTLEIQGLLQQFQKQWLSQLEELGADLPRSLEIHTRIIKGNPRSLTGTMNGIIGLADYMIFDRELGLALTEERLNETPWSGPDYTIPFYAVKEMLEENPLPNPTPWN